jgi:hypothetical protein
VTENGFKRRCISSALDETDDILWNSSEEVGSECEEIEGTDCEDEHSDADW